MPGRTHDRLRGAAATAAIGIAAALLAPRSAQACVKVAHLGVLFPISPSLQHSDREPPVPFSNVQAHVYRQKGEVCRNGECVASSCGDMAGIQFTYERLGAPDEEVGYYFEVLEGTRPPELVATILNPVALAPPSGLSSASSLSFELDFDDVVRLDAVVTLVAIDRAGNSSTPSEPVRLVWSGCTLHPNGQECLEEEGACAVRPGTVAPSGAGWVAGLIVLSLGARRRYLASPPAALR